MTKDKERLIKAVESVNDTLRKYYDNIGNETEEDYKNGETFTSYINDMLDVKYILNRDKSFNGVQLLAAFGGSTIWIDTSDMEIKGYWGIDRYYCRLDGDIADEIDMYFEEIF